MPGFQTPSNQVSIAAIGYVNGMGSSNTNAAGKVANITALCDVDESDWSAG